MALLLLVDDNPLVGELVTQQLEELHTVITAANGASGVETARSARPDLVLMDLTMPVMDGWAAIRALRSDPVTAHLPIVALSAGDTEGAARALAAGADAYLAKPIDEVALKNTILRVLTTSGVRRRGVVEGAREPTGSFKR